MLMHGTNRAPAKIDSCPHDISRYHLMGYDSLQFHEQSAYSLTVEHDARMCSPIISGVNAVRGWKVVGATRPDFFCRRDGGCLGGLIQFSLKSQDCLRP